MATPNLTPSLVITAQQMGQFLLPALRAIVGPGPDVPEVRLLDSLDHLELPVDLVTRLRRAFDIFGFSVEIVILDHQLGIPERRHLHKVTTKNGDEFYMIHVPMRFLNQPRGENISVVDYIRHFLPKPTRVFVMSPEVDGLNITFRRLFFENWKEADIEVTFIQWNDVIDWHDPRLATANKSAYLKNVFGLNSSKPANSRSIPLTDDEEKLVAQIIADQAVAVPSAVGAKSFFESLIKYSRLPKPWVKSRLVFAGDVDSIARELVHWANETGTNPNNPTHCVLAEFFVRMIENGLKSEDVKTLYDLVHSKNLISNGKALDKFRELCNGSLPR
jgi:hypothetical protein